MAHSSLCRMIKIGPLKISKSLKKAENDPFGKNLFPITALIWRMKVQCWVSHQSSTSKIKRYNDSYRTPGLTSDMEDEGPVLGIISVINIIDKTPGHLVSPLIRRMKVWYWISHQLSTSQLIKYTDSCKAPGLTSDIKDGGLCWVSYRISQHPR